MTTSVAIEGGLGSITAHLIQLPQFCAGHELCPLYSCRHGLSLSLSLSLSLQWQPDTLSTDTSFVLGVNVNK